MKKLHILLIALFILGVTENSISQDSYNPFILYSKKKISRIVLNDGSKLNGYLKGIKRSKGLIEKIVVESLDGKKHKLDAKDIDFMYLAPNRLIKFVSALELWSDATFWNDDDFTKVLLAQKYIKFEKSEVYLKGRKGARKTFLLPVLNLSFCNKIKIFPDPNAYESHSVKIVGIKVKKVLSSYYVKKGDDAAFKIDRWNYKKYYKELYAGCDELVNMKKPKWSNFIDHVRQYSTCEE